MTGERRAIAAAVLAFYSFIFFLVALQPPPGWGPTFGGLAIVYTLGFFSVVAGYFWARWYAIGVGLSGLLSAGVSIWQMGPEPVLLFYGGTHGAISLILWGRAMAKPFDGRADWRERFHMDENATHRLGKAVIRVGISLPYVIMYALAPREGAMSTLLFAAGAGFAVAGIWALLRLRTWGIAALGAAGIAILATLGATAPVAAVYAAPAAADQAGGQMVSYGIDLLALGTAGAVLLLAATLPFAGPALRYLRGR